MTNSDPVVLTAESAEQVEAVRGLMRGFLVWQRGRPAEEQHLIDAYFDETAWEAEVDGLPGAYEAPSGRLLLATVSGDPAGCVALRGLDAERCEMKRMFVHQRFQGQGVGRALADAVVDAARSIGYTTMWLDTSAQQTQALTLYRSLGFVDVPPSHDVSEELAAWLVFMRLDL